MTLFPFRRFVIYAGKSVEGFLHAVASLLDLALRSPRQRRGIRRGRGFFQRRNVRFDIHIFLYGL